MNVKNFLEGLLDRYPNDAQDLEEAWKNLSSQRINDIDRLQKLSDSQWSRLNIPLGVEAIIREELETLINAPSEEPPEEPEKVLRQRKGGSTSGQGITMRPKNHFERAQSGSTGNTNNKPVGFSDLSLEPPDNLDEQWSQLLFDTLPPDRRDMLQKSWDEMGDDNRQDKYMMFLEYSSYLRKPENNSRDKQKTEKRMEPLLREYGLQHEVEGDSRMGLLWLGFGVLILLCGGGYYYFFGPHVPTRHEEIL